MDYNCHDVLIIMPVRDAKKKVLISVDLCLLKILIIKVVKGHQGGQKWPSGH